MGDRALGVWTVQDTANVEFNLDAAGAGVYVVYPEFAITVTDSGQSRATSEFGTLGNQREQVTASNRSPGTLTLGILATDEADDLYADLFAADDAEREIAVRVGSLDGASGSRVWTYTNAKITNLSGGSYDANSPGPLQATVTIQYSTRTLTTVA